MLLHFGRCQHFVALERLDGNALAVELEHRVRGDVLVRAQFMFFAAVNSGHCRVVTERHRGRLQIQWCQIVTAGCAHVRVSACVNVCVRVRMRVCVRAPACVIGGVDVGLL